MSGVMTTTDNPARKHALKIPNWIRLICQCVRKEQKKPSKMHSHIWAIIRINKSPIWPHNSELQLLSSTMAIRASSFNDRDKHCVGLNRTLQNRGIHRRRTLTPERARSMDRCPCLEIDTKRRDDEQVPSFLTLPFLSFISLHTSTVCSSSC